MPLFTAIGLMSGTSMDGVDVALIETDGRNEVRQGPSLFRPYGAADRKLLRAALDEAVGLSDRHARPPAILACERMVTRRHGEAVERFLEQNAIAAADVEVVGFHGQTVIHRPREGLTVQIGDGQGLADRLGISVAYDFRAADVAAGGEGAPVVPVYHRALIEAAGIMDLKRADVPVVGLVTDCVHGCGLQAVDRCAQLLLLVATSDRHPAGAGAGASSGVGMGMGMGVGMGMSRK